MTDHPNRHPILFLLAMSVYYLGTNYLWISFNSFVLPIQVESFASPEAKSLVLGLIAGPTIAASLLINILSGILSDHSTSRFGRRSPYILIGSLLAVPGVILTVIFPVSMLITSLSFIGVEVFTNLSCGSYQPLLADIVPEDQRGIAGGLQGMMILFGSALGYGVTGLLAGQGNLQLALILIAAVLVVTTSVTLYAIKIVDRRSSRVEPFRIGTAIGEVFRFRPRIPDFSWFMLGHFLIMLGSTNLMFFGLYYFESVLKVENPSEAMAITGVTILLISAISAVVLGSLSDRIGRRKMIIAAAVFAAALNVLFPFVTTFAVLLAVASAYAITIGLFNSVTNSFASDLVPKEESGKYMAYFNLAIGLANASSPVVAGTVLFLLGGAQSWAGFAAIFVLSSLFYCLGAALIFKVRKR